MEQRAPTSQEAVQKSATAGRGPAYPFIPLDKAVERAEQIRDANLIRTAAPPVAIYKLWGYGGDNGKSRQTMAALNHFGLLEYVGRGDQRQIKLSDLAHRIVLDRVPDSVERAAALREAALLPSIYGKLWVQYGSALPPDVVIETFLTRDCGYGLEAAENVLSGYKETFHYAGLGQPLSSPPKAPQSEVGDELDQKPQVGDLVQVEIDGSLALERPSRLRAVREHEGREWGFVDGTETGFPLECVVTVEKAVSLEHVAAPPKLSESPSFEIAKPQGNEQEWLRGPLSKEVSYRLFVKGEIGPREIGKLIKLLEAQKAVLSEDED